MKELQEMLFDTVGALSAVVQEDWVEDGRFEIKDREKAEPLIEKANEIIVELGEYAPVMYKDKQFLVYGSQLKCLPKDRIEGAKALAATFQ